MAEPIVVQAIFPFKGSNNDELCFKKGDLITVTQRDEGWWEGTLNGKTGWFPSNYVKETSDAPKPIILQQNQYKSVVLKDLIDSERAHVTELEGLVTNFLQPLEKSSILSFDEYKQLTGNLLDVLETHQQLLSLIEAEEAKPSLEQRVGRLFLTWAPRMKNVHQAYCSLHPRAVCILDKFKDELTKYMESRGAASPGVLVLTTLLSKPFRRLDKYSGMLQELERHVEECHPDRGDTQRSVAVYKEIATSCSATRRQKELELQVLTGPVRGWEGPSLTALGDIIYMGSVAVGPQHHDRYFVLFPSTLLILSVSHRLSAFIYEGKLPLSGLVVNRLEDSDQYKNAFEISAPMIEKRIAVCQSKNEANHWVELLKKHMPRSSNAASMNHKVSPSQAQFIPQSPHLNRRGYSNRLSILQYKSSICDYTPIYPPENYPSAAPYATLTKHFSKLIKEKIITSKLLRKLLYSEYLNKMNLNLVKIRHHKVECVIIPKTTNCRVSVINCDSDSDNSSSDDVDDPKFRRQNAVIESSSGNSDDNSSSSGGSSSSNPFGYIRYYNPQTGLERETKYESIIDYGELTSHGEVIMIEDTPKKNSVVVTSIAKLELTKQNSETSEASSCLTPKPYLGCEDLVNLDDNTEIKTLTVPQKYFPMERQSCPTKLVGNKFNQSSLTTIYIPSWSNSDNNINCSKKFEDTNSSTSTTTTHSSSIELEPNIIPLPNPVLAEILYNLPTEQSSNSSSVVIKPPTLFCNSTTSLNLDDRKLKVVTPRRRSSIQINPQDLNRAKDMKRCVSSSYLRMSSDHCCCMDYNNHSPRSSDSGMAGSCTLNSPDLNSNDMMAVQERCSQYMANMLGEDRAGITLSEIEARDFESQCPCTSPFGSTPRTSCQPSISGNNSIRTSVTSSLDLCPQPWPNISSTNTTTNSRPMKSKSMECLVNKGLNVVKEDVEVEKTDTPIYRSGLYAHWWLKAKIPASVVKGIYLDTRSPTTGKGTSPLVAAGTAANVRPGVLNNRSTPTPPPHGVPATNKSWSATCLRPSPPLRPCLALGATPASSYNRSGRKPMSYKEDGIILDVIEAYCCTVKPRNTVNSVDITNGPKSELNKNLIDAVQALQSKVNILEYNVSALSSELHEERSRRSALQNIVKNYLTINCKEFDNIEWPTLESNI